jgi:hypothetical protein
MRHGVAGVLAAFWWFRDSHSAKQTQAFLRCGRALPSQKRERKVCKGLTSWLFCFKTAAAVSRVPFLSFFLLVARDGGGTGTLGRVSPIAIGAAEFNQKTRVIMRDHIRHSVPPNGIA